MLGLQRGVDGPRLPDLFALAVDPRDDLAVLNARAAVVT
jgi:hypothetical protein